MWQAGPGRVDRHQHCVAIAVEPDADDLHGVAAGSSLAPQLARARLQKWACPLVTVVVSAVRSIQATMSTRPVAAS